MWVGDERTVKRETSKLRTLGRLVQKRAAVRGSEAVHGLDLDATFFTTASDGDSVGPPTSSPPGISRVYLPPSAANMAPSAM